MRQHLDTIDRIHDVAGVPIDPIAVRRTEPVGPHHRVLRGPVVRTDPQRRPIGTRGEHRPRLIVIGDTEPDMLERRRRERRHGLQRTPRTHKRVRLRPRAIHTQQTITHRRRTRPVPIRRPETAPTRRQRTPRELLRHRRARHHLTITLMRDRPTRTRGPRRKISDRRIRPHEHRQHERQRRRRRNRHRHTIAPTISR